MDGRQAMEAYLFYKLTSEPLAQLSYQEEKQNWQKRNWNS